MTLTGRAAMLAFAAVVVVALVPAGGRTVGWVALALAVAVAVDLLLAGSPRQIEMSRAGATSTRLGEPAEVALLLRNAGSRGARGRVRDAWPPSAGAIPSSYPLDLGPGQRTRLVTTVVPTRRGERRADAVTIRCLGPLGVAGRQRSRAAPWVVRVLPAFTSRRYLPDKLAKLRELDGSVVAPVRGQGTEFDALRDYVPGDDPRAIDWRATARRATPAGPGVVVRTWRPERDRQVLLVLDSGRTAAGRVGGAPRFDAALEAVLLMAALAQHAGDRVALLVHDAVPRASVDFSARSGDVLAAVASATAGVEPALVETDTRALVAQVLRRVRRRSLVVWFTTLEPAAVDDDVLAAMATLLSRHVVCVASVTDPRLDELRVGRHDADEVYAAASAEAAAHERATIATRLRRAGVEVVEAPPEPFPSVVADAYLAMKAAGRL